MSEHQGPKRGIAFEESSNGFFPKGKSYLLVIGIDEYEHFPQLYNAVKDAKDVSAVLIEQYQFSKENCFQLLNKEASQSAIFQKLDELSELITKEDTLLIYFSGHGEYKSKLDVGFWIPVDGEPRNTGSFLSFTLLSRYIKAISSFHTLVIADSCYAGSLFTTRSSETLKNRLESRPSRWLITAGRNEVVADGKPGDNSPFADALLWELRNNQEARFRVSSFAESIIDAVVRNADQTPQAAEMYGVDSKGGEFMFRLKKHSKTPFQEEKVEREAMDIFRGDSNVEEMKKPEDFASLEDFVKYLKKLIANTQFEEVFELLETVLKSDCRLYDDIHVRLLRRYTEFKQQEEHLDRNERKKELAGIENSFLICRRFEKAKIIQSSCTFP